MRRAKARERETRRRELARRMRKAKARERETERRELARRVRKAKARERGPGRRELARRKNFEGEHINGKMYALSKALHGR